MDEQELVPPDVRHWLEQRGIRVQVQLANVDGTAVSPETMQAFRQYAMELAERRSVFQRLVALGELSASLAHEVRNALAGISGLSQLKTRGSSPEWVRIIRSETERCSRLLSDFLGFAVPAGTPIACLSAKDIFEPVHLMLAAEAKSRRCGLVTKIEPRVSSFHGRPRELRQVVLNLALNALQAAPEGSTVELVATPSSAGISLQVLDNGPGIAPELLESIFEPFVTTKAATGGVGLGLWTSRRLVEEMGGVLRAENRSGGGARFEVRLPLGAASASSLPPTGDRE